MYTINVVHLTRRFILFVIILVGTFLLLFSYFFSNSRAGRITSNEEYISSLEQAARGRRVAGQEPVVIVSLTPYPQIKAITPQPTNIWESFINKVFDFFLD